MEQVWFSQREISEVFGIKASTLANWRTHGKGPTYSKVGQLVRYNINNVNKFFERNRVRTTEGP